MTVETHKAPVLVACCGQEMAGDDAFGLRVAQALHALKLPDTKIVMLAAKPSGLLDHLPGPRILIMVDAVQDPSGNPGQLIDLDWFDPARPPLAHETVLSSHGLSIAGQIDLAGRLGICPPLVQLVGCTIGSVQVGQAMHHTVHRQVPSAARRVAALVERVIGQQAIAGLQE